MEILAQSGTQFTLFAPTNDAFAKAKLEGCSLKDVLLYHVISGKRLLSTDLKQTQQVQTALTGSVDLFITEYLRGQVVVDAPLTQARVTTPNLGASNGVIHIIDAVLVPQCRSQKKAILCSMKN